MYKLNVPKNVEYGIVLIITLLFIPWGIYFNKPQEQENIYKQSYRLLSSQPLLWGLLVIAIGYFSIVKPSISIMLMLFMLSSIMSVQ